MNQVRAEQVATHTYSSQRGLSTFGPGAVSVLAALERCFTRWAADVQAERMLFPALVPVASLEKLDYFENFPHLGVLTSALTDEQVAARAQGDSAEYPVPASHLRASEYALPSAACYNIYVHLEGSTLPDARRITTVAQCFRNERHYKGLERLMGFTLREIVCLGAQDAVHKHLSWSKQRLLAFAETIDLPITVKPASDPFFDKRSSRAVMARMFPVKDEILYGGELAIASINSHRNFFGERFHISTTAGEPVHSACVGMGLERWLHALLHRYDENVDRILSALERASA